MAKWQKIPSPPPAASHAAPAATTATVQRDVVASGKPKSMFLGRKTAGPAAALQNMKPGEQIRQVAFLPAGGVGAPHPLGMTKTSLIVLPQHGVPPLSMSKIQDLRHSIQDFQLTHGSDPSLPLRYRLLPTGGLGAKTESIFPMIHQRPNTLTVPVGSSVMAALTQFGPNLDVVGVLADIQAQMRSLGFGLSRGDKIWTGSMGITFDKGLLTWTTSVPNGKITGNASVGFFSQKFLASLRAMSDRSRTPMEDRLASMYTEM